MFDFLPKDAQVTEKDLANTPPAVLNLLFAMAEEITRLNKRIEELEAKLAETVAHLGIICKGRSTLWGERRLVAGLRRPMPMRVFCRLNRAMGLLLGAVLPCPIG